MQEAGWPGARLGYVCSRHGLWFSGKAPSKPTVAGPALQLTALVNIIVTGKPPSTQENSNLLRSTQGCDLHPLSPRAVASLV